MATDTADSLVETSGLYALLAGGFSHPDAAVVKFLRNCVEAQPRGDGELFAKLHAVLEAFEGLEPDELRSAYMRLFDPMAGPHPYEVEHQKSHDFSKVHVLADIMGFYKAFGVDPRSDRPDHIACELEFLHCLALKEAHALHNDQPENAEICREARAKFFSEHLEPWAGSLIAELRAGTQEVGPFYTHLIDLLEMVVEREKEDLT